LRGADLRYPRQAYELTVPVAEGPITRQSLDRLADGFHDKHRQTYGHGNPDEPVQLVNLRLTAIGRLPGLTLAQPPAVAPLRGKVKTPMAELDPATPVPRAENGVGGWDTPDHGVRARRAREVWFPQIGSVPCPVHWRDGLAAGETLSGPAIVETMDSTIVVPPGWIASVDGKGYIRLRRR
jgi:N-methylhydantoinase A